MKKSILKVAFAITIVAIFYNSCASPDQKVDAAQANLQEAKQDLREAKKDSVTAAIKAASADEWKLFKNDAEATIKNNEIRIAQLKEKMKNSGDAMNAVYSKKIDDMEMHNHNLKLKVENYEKNNSDWETFKAEFNHDVNELGQALKDFTITNKK